MQAVVSLPSTSDVNGLESGDERLFRRVSGIPLLVRVLATAARSGVTSVLLVRPARLSETLLRERLRSSLTSSLSIEMIGVEHAFDPTSAADWARLAPRLQPKFLWLPWNYVTVKRELRALVAGETVSDSAAPALAPTTGEPGAAGSGHTTASGTLSAPIVVDRDILLTAHRGRLDRYVRDSASPSNVLQQPSGIAVDSDHALRQAERLLVRGSGKETDGIYSNFNRRLCRPAVRWLARTPVTPNVVTLAGLPVVALAGYAYAQGFWAAYVAGALLYFLSVELDEMDGMLARARFQESPLGCWLETIVDYTSYLFLWVGMSAGLSRQYRNPVWLELGGLTIVMSVLIFFALVRLRRLGTTPDRPEQFDNRYMGKLDADSANPISFGIRKIAFLAKKGVMAHYVVLFSVLGLLPLFVGLAAFGSVLTLAIVLYSSRFFRAPVHSPAMDLPA